MLAHLALMALAAIPSVTAFGPVGNQAVALVAQNFMTAKTIKAVNKMLGGDASVAIVNAATYGNRYSATPEGAWSTAGFSMFPNDAPAAVCNLSVLLDCSTAGCAMTAFGNFTNILTDYPTPSTAAQKSQALRLLISLFPAMHTPLLNTAATGTNINIKYQGATQTLSTFWSTTVPNALSNTNATTLATSLLSTFKGNSTLLANLSTCWSITTMAQYVGESNALACTAVYAGDGYSPADIAGKELKGNYYKNVASPVVKERIASAGYRMAAYLNLIFQGEPGLVVPGVAIVPMCNTTALTHAGTAFKTS